jgi:hypothetical protein
VGPSVYKQVRHGRCMNTLSIGFLTGCKQLRPKLLASNEETFKNGLNTGGLNRSSPTGGSANGIPMASKTS